MPTDPTPTRRAFLQAAAVTAAGASLALGEARPGWVPLDGTSGDLRLIRERWLELNALTAADRDQPAVRRAVEERAARARELMAAQVREAESPLVGSWGDIESVNNEAISFHGGYFTQPQALAAAWGCPLSPLYREAALGEALNASLSFGARYFHVDAPRPNNWWAWDIGIPMRLLPALLCAGEALEPGLRQGLVDTLYWEGRKPVGIGFEKPGTGANAIWIANNALLLSLLCGDEALLARAGAIFADICRLGGEKGDGIMPDGSFHQHGNGVNMGYGHAMLVDCATYLYLTHGTAIGLPERSIEALRRFFAEYAIWDTYRGTTNPYSSGRAGTRPGNWNTKAVATAAELLLARRVEGCIEPARAHLNDAFGGDREAILSLTPALTGALGPELEAIVAAPPLASVRAWPYSDLIASRGAGHFFAARLACDTKGWFSIHNENLRAHQTGEGSVVVMTDGLEYDQDGTINQPWDALMGVSFVPGLTRGREAMGQSLAVGCAALPGIGMFAADYRIQDEANVLAGAKAYVLLEDLLVLLGADLHTSMQGGITTTLFSARLPAGAGSVGAANDNAIWSGGKGVVVLEGGADVTVRTLECDYTEVNQRYPGRPAMSCRQLEVQTVSPPRGPQTYAALVCAGRDERGFAELVADPRIEVVSNTSEAQAVRTADGLRGATAVYGNAWRGAAGGLSARGVLLWAVGDGVAEVLLSRRNSPAETVRIALPFALGAAPEGTRLEGDELVAELPAGYVVERRWRVRLA